MPYNGSGTFSIINSFVANTTILSAAVNQNFTDIASGLSDVLTRDGQAGMTAALGLIAGSSSAPSLKSNSDATSGLYFPATGSVALVAEQLGLKLNAMTNGALSAVVSAGGSNYAVGDTIYTTGGTFAVPAAFTVATLSGSAVATVTMAVPGIYTATPSNPVAQGSTTGSGTGCTLTVTYNNLVTPVYNLGITDLSNALLWQKFGASSFMSGLMGKAAAYDVLSSLVSFGTGISVNKTTSPPTLTAPAVPVAATFKNLSIKVATNTTVAVAADAVIVTDGTNFASVAPSATCNLGTNGAVNTLDTGTIAIDSWYYIYVIYNGSTTGTLASLSSTAPTMPSGYTYKARIGAVQTIHGSAVLYGTWQFGRQAQYIVGLTNTTTVPIAQSGAHGDASVPTWTSVSLVRYVPTTASMVRLIAQNQSGSAMSIAPNSSYGSNTSTTNPPPVVIAGGASAAMSTTLLLESTSVSYAAAGSSTAMGVLGWEDNI